MLTAREKRLADALVASHGGLTRVDLGLVTGDSPPTIHRGLADLRERGWLVEETERTVGAQVRLGRGAGAIAAVDVGRQHVRGVICDLHANPLSEPLEYEAIDFEQQGEAVLETVVDVVRRALDRASAGGDEPYRLSEIRSLAVGVPTPVGPGGTVTGPFIGQWSGLPLEPTLRGLLTDEDAPAADRPDPQLSIAIAKDAELGALAAWRDFEREKAERHANGNSARRPQEVVMFVKASHGIDAGVVCDGRLYTGNQGMAVQIGHMPVSAAAGRHLEQFRPKIRELEPMGECLRCGSPTCLEHVASGRAQLELLPRLIGEKDAPSTLQALVDEVNDIEVVRPVSRELVVAAGLRIGATLGEAARLLAPGRIVVGGLLAETGETFRAPLEVGFRQGTMDGIDAEIVAVPRERVKRIELEGAIEQARRQLSFEVVPNASRSGA